MNITLMYNRSDPSYWLKELSELTTVSGEIKESSSVINPTVIIRADIVDNALADNFNYIYIPKWNRYYFVKDMMFTTGNRCEVICEVDDLESNRTELLDCYGYVQRGSRPADWDNYTPDSLIPTKTNVVNRNISFDSSPFNVVSASDPLGSFTFNYLLTVVGGED